MKKETTFKIIFTTILILISFLSLELIAFLSLSEAEKKIPVSQIIKKQENIFAELFESNTSCFFVQTTIMHPVLGFIHRRPEVKAPNCYGGANNIGMHTSLDLPLMKKEDEYAVMIVGGSVAYQLSIYKLDEYGHNQLSRVLNKLYYPPKGKKEFRVYTGAIGGWAMPTQVSMLTMYNERIDAAIALDGYNESFSVAAGTRLEVLPVEQSALIGVSSTGLYFKILNGLWYYRKIVSSTFLKYSYLMNVMYKVGLGISKNIIIDDITRKEFTIGTTEQINLPAEQAQEWTLGSLEGYIRKFYLIGNALDIKTAHFLQPSRIYGKALTPEEALVPEGIKEEIYRKVNRLYTKLHNEKMPVYDLTNVFSNEKERIYSDHIHFLSDGEFSKGNEIIIANIARLLGEAWNLQKREN